MAKLVSTIINGFVQSKNFITGALGSGWQIALKLGRWVLEIDDLVVRGRMTVFELLIQKIRAVKGALGITQANGKIKEVREDDTNYYITIEDEMSFVANDIIRCQTFSSGQKSYWVIVSSISNNEIVIPKSEFEGWDIPATGDEIVQFGNTTDKARQSAIYLHADEGGDPAIDVLFGIHEKNFNGCTKVRIGGGIPGAEGCRGFYCENGMIKSVNEVGEIMYMLRPDGSGLMAKGNISWDTNGNGSIFNKAIYWDTGGFHFGSGIKLTWDNLDDTVRENLKGDPGIQGEPGKDGLNGADGVNGSDGVSIVWKGSFSSHPANPRNGWAYKNTKDKKSYVYQDGAWYQMTIDGVDGINGKDGADGLDIVWKGDSSIPPSNPVKNWVYRDFNNGRVYIYNGTSWVLMVADGNDGTDGTNGKDGVNGKDGMNVYITYHDGETEPSRPAGDGTTGGWHTNSTASVIWMSQKVASSVSSGTWGNPIRIGSTGEANLFPWLSDWNNNKTEIDGESVVSPKMFSGTKGSGGKLTGVAFGRDVIEIDGVKKTGVFGLKDGRVTFSVDSETGDAMFRGHVESKTGEIGELEIANGGISGKDDNGVTRLRISKEPLSNFGDLANDREDVFISNYLFAKKAFSVSAFVDDDMNIDRDDDNVTLGFKSSSFTIITGCDLVMNVEKILSDVQHDPNRSDYDSSLEEVSVFNNDLTKIGEATLASNGSYNISIPSAGTYYVWVSIKVKMSLRFISPREGDTVTGNVQAKLSAKGIFSQQCTIVGCDGIYSYWGPMDYFYMKKNSAGQLDIKMRGNVQIMRRDGTVLVQ